MLTNNPSRDAPSWDAPDRCPFCAAKLTDGGAGFIDHIAVSPSCHGRFETWREAVVNDIEGDWSG